jgi:hypothetical protein
MTETYTANEAEAVFPPRTVDAFRRVLELVQEDNPQFDPSLVLDMATSVALKRATLLGREVIPLDVEFSLSVFCWWPLKPPPTREFGSECARGYNPLSKVGMYTRLNR